jgi:hypothetical protein
MEDHAGGDGHVEQADHGAFKVRDEDVATWRQVKVELLAGPDEVDGNDLRWRNWSKWALMGAGHALMARPRCYHPCGGRTVRPAGLRRRTAGYSQ